MLLAYGEDGGRVLAMPEGIATCPCCDEEVVPKCGKVVTWHWAHKSKTDCDPWGEAETIWHAAWKSRYENTEVVIDKHIDGVSSRHRADAVSKVYDRDMVLEFQHSAIRAAEVRAREDFYQNMIWIIDASAARRNQRVYLRYYQPESGSPYCTFKWKHRRRSFDLHRCPMFLDFGVSWVPAGEIVYKERRWWDDAGLRDGVARQPGWWQRFKKYPCLLDVRKCEEGRGWGRLVSHEAFCDMTGAARFIPHRCSSPCEVFNHFDEQTDKHEQYGWCMPQLEHFGARFNKEEIV
jgi:hypothetical protein